MKHFSIARLPRIEFGRGVFKHLPNLLANYGKHVLLVTGASAFSKTPQWLELTNRLQELGMKVSHVTIAGEPSPAMMDEIVAAHGNKEIDVVAGIGGGSPMDAAKAIAGLLNVQHSVMQYLEGVGPELPYHGPAVPFVAVPTTAGTGSEATRNAVLSIQSREGFKKSFRHDKLVAEYAVVDPALLASCPPNLIAANGMDALTQLIESYVSTRANAFTDSLALEGIRLVRDSLLSWYEKGADATEEQDNMAYAAMISGITLAQVGLGSVHGLASPMGAFFPIPHGVVCGTLLAAATKVNIDALREREPGSPALMKYRKLAEVLLESHIRDDDKAYAAIVKILSTWCEKLNLPRLSEYGVNKDDLDLIVANARGSSMKTNPIVLTDNEIRAILLEKAITGFTFMVAS